MYAQSMKTILAASRLPFLVLAPVCIFLACASIYYSFQTFKVSLFACILAGAIFAHASVNLFNEYLDFQSGLDFKTKRTPFSGGSGALPSQPNAAKTVLYAAIGTFLMTSSAGLYLLYDSYHRFDGLNISLLIIGFAGLILILLYTGPINRNPWLCLISPGLGFGFFMVYGSSSILLGYLPLSLFPAALLLFLLVNNLLLLNQLPDIEADSAIGRKHLWIAKGQAIGLNFYLFTTLLIPVLFLIAVLCKIWPILSVLALLPWGLTISAWRGAKVFTSEIGEHPEYLAMNVIATLCVPSVLSLVLFLSA